MKTVYDSEGRAYTVDSVDAREYVATGNYFYEKPEKEKAEVKEDKSEVGYIVKKSKIARAR